LTLPIFIIFVLAAILNFSALFSFAHVDLKMGEWKKSIITEFVCPPPCFWRRNGTVFGQKDLVHSFLQVGFEGN